MDIQVKETLNNPKLWQTLSAVLMMVAGYFGYEVMAPPPTEVDVDIDLEHAAEHTHPQHGHKNWQPEIDKAIQAHKRAYH